MLRSVVRFSLRFSWLVIAVAVGTVVLGVAQFSNARKDLLPEFTPTQVEVQTEALGLSAYEVEQLITVPLEQDLLNGIAFLSDIESASLPGLSSVVMTFEPGTDILDARQIVAERITQAVAVAGLPQVADTPQMIQPLSSTSRLALVSLSSSVMSPIEQSVEARWIIVPALLGVDGVANVSIFGFRDRQLQVLADPERLNAEQLDLADVIRTTGNSLEVSPLSFLEASSPGTGGFIDTANQRLHVFHEQTISTPEELAQVPIEDDEGGVVLRNGAPLLLGDVTDIVEDHQPLIGDALCSGGPCVLLVIEKFPDANTPEVAADIASTLESLQPGLPDIVFDTSIYEPASFIDMSLSNLAVTLLIGAGLLILVIGLLFLEWRTAFIAVVTIATSLAAAVLVMSLFDVTFNAMVIAGLVMALVVIIDQAVSGAGALALRAAEPSLGANGHSAARTVMHAALETGRSSLYVLAIVTTVLIPFFVMNGVAGAFFPVIAVAYLTALVVGLAVGLTVAPALGLLMLRGSGLVRESSLAQRLKERFERGSLRTGRPVAPFLALSIVVAVGLSSLFFVDSALRPSLQERDLVVALEGPPGMSLTRMDQIAADFVDEVGGMDGVENVAAHVGRAITSDQIVNVNSAEVWVSLTDSADYDATVDAIRNAAAGQGDMSGAVSTYSEQRVNDVLGQAGNEIVVRVYGEDDASRAATAEEIRNLVAGVDGVSEAEVFAPLEQDTIEVEVDLVRAQALGLKPGDVRRTVATLLSGITVGNLFEDQKVFDVVVWGPPELRQAPEDVENLLITTPTGSQVPLSEVADVRIVSAPTVIRHESVEKFLDVRVVTDSGDLGGLADDISSELEELTLPAEFHAAVLGGFEEAAANRSAVIAAAIAALVAFYLLFQSAFASWRLATMALALLPMVAAGSLIATLIYSREVSLGVMAGMISVVGMAAGWLIVLVNKYQAIERDGTEFGPELVSKGTADRFLPVLASGSAILAFMLPSVVRAGTPGLEIVGPLAVATVGGVLAALLLVLFVFPAVYGRWGRNATADRSADDLFIDLQPESELV